MVSKFECPRCGAGIRPGDIQCGRCGAILDDRVEAKDLPTTPLTLRSIGDTVEKKVRIDPVGPPTSRGGLLERKQKKLEEREGMLRRREEELRAATEQLEKDARALDAAIDRFEKEMMELDRRKEELERRQEQMEVLYSRVSQLRTADGDDRVRERAFAEAVNEFQQILDDERERLRRGMEIEEGRGSERLFLMERQLRAVMESTGNGSEAAEQVENKDAEDPSARMREVFEVLDHQIGAGFEDQPEDDPLSTHIDKLDQILAGGIPRGHVVLIHGTTGALKSSLAHFILHRNATRAGVRGLYVSLEQTEESLVRQMRRMGMSSEGTANLLVSDMVQLKKAMRGVQGNWREILMRFVGEVVEAHSIEMLALDSLESFKAMAEFAFTREDLRDLFDWFRELGVTVLLISELPMEELIESGRGELYLADGAIEMMMRDTANGRVHRWLRCLKMRGAAIDTRYFAFAFERGEFIIRSPLV